MAEPTSSDPSCEPEDVTISAIGFGKRGFFGVSIGAFRLGMSRAEVDALGIQRHRVIDESATYFPLTGGADESPLDDTRGTGVTVFFDKSGQSIALEARLTLTPDDPPLFTLGGQILNGTHVTRIGGDQAGIRFIKWELSDDFYFAVDVFSPSQPENAYPYAARHE